MCADTETWRGRATGRDEMTAIPGLDIFRQVRQIVHRRRGLMLCVCVCVCARAHPHTHMLAHSMCVRV